MTSEITTQSVEGESSIYKNTDSFEFAQRQAKSLCESNLVPISYQGQKGLPAIALICSTLGSIGAIGAGGGNI